MITTKNVTTRVQLSEDTKTFEVLYSKDGKNYLLHKDGFKSIDEAVKETTRVNGAIRLLRDINKK
jgi:hypothetical protein